MAHVGCISNLHNRHLFWEITTVNGKAIGAMGDLALRTVKLLILMNVASRRLASNDVYDCSNSKRGIYGVIGSSVYQIPDKTRI